MADEPAKRPRGCPPGLAKPKVADKDSSSEQPARRVPKDLAYKATKSRAPHTAKSRGLMEEEAEQEEEQQAEEEEGGEPEEEGEEEPDKEEDALGHLLKPITHWAHKFILDGEGEEDEEDDDEENTSHGEKPSSPLRDYSPLQYPSSPIEQRCGRTDARTLPECRARSERAVAKVQMPSKTPSRERTQPRGGPTKVTRGRPRSKAANTPAAKAGTRRRAASADTPGNTPATTPRAPPKKKAKKAQAVVLTLDDADQEMESVVPPPKGKKKNKRHVSFSEPEPEPVSPELGTPASPYDRHFPFLSPASNRHRRPPQRSPEDMEGWDYDPDNDKITLTRKQLAQLIASGPMAKMAEFSKSDNGGKTARRRAAAAKRVAAAIELGMDYSAVLRMPGAPSPKAKRIVSLKPGKIIDPHRLAIPEHVKESLRGGMKTYFPLSDLTAANCTAGNQRGPRKRQLVVAGLEFTTDGSERPGNNDDYITKSDWITAGDRLLDAIKEHFVPRALAEQFAQQMKVHLERIRKSTDFDTNFWRYQTYHTAIMKTFVDEPNFDVSE
ncbi:hypothetical protein FB451DRAFT_1184712 [Mycena latifolia]|nr:hypothetical protein FB451DRAFT_1184712 [Mycena latifolia]